MAEAMEGDAVVDGQSNWFLLSYKCASASLCMQITSLGLTVLITFMIVWRSACPEV